jgi:hypothetical protein
MHPFAHLFIMIGSARYLVDVFGNLGFALPMRCAE